MTSCSPEPTIPEAIVVSPPATNALTGGAAGASSRTGPALASASSPTPVVTARVAASSPIVKRQASLSSSATTTATHSKEGATAAPAATSPVAATPRPAMPWLKRLPSETEVFLASARGPVNPFSDATDPVAAAARVHRRIFNHGVRVQGSHLLVAVDDMSWRKTDTTVPCTPIVWTVHWYDPLNPPPQGDRDLVTGLFPPPPPPPKFTVHVAAQVAEWEHAWNVAGIATATLPAPLPAAVAYFKHHTPPPCSVENRLAWSEALVKSGLAWFGHMTAVVVVPVLEKVAPSKTQVPPNPESFLAVRPD